MNGLDLTKTSVIVDTSNNSNFNDQNYQPQQKRNIEVTHEKSQPDSHATEKSAHSFKSNSQRIFDQKNDLLKNTSSASNFRTNLEVKFHDRTSSTGNLKKEIEQIKKDLIDAQNENSKLKEKMLESQQSVQEERNQSGKWKSMYTKAIQDMSNTEKHMLKNSASVDKLDQGSYTQIVYSNENKISEILSNLDESKLSKEQIFMHKQTLKSTVQELQNQNLNLKRKLEKLQSSNTKGLEKLKYFYNENNKLKTELKLMTSRKQTDASAHAKAQYELNTEIKNLNTKLRFEQAQRDELKQQYDVEVSAAKIRYDNELQKQNGIMQEKNQSLMTEISRLNESIKNLQEEKLALLTKMKARITDGSPLMHNSSSVSTSSSLSNSKIIYSNYGKTVEMVP